LRLPLTQQIVNVSPFSMSETRRLNGCDYLMLALDYELRRDGYAGNSCQIILELDAPVSAEPLRKRLEVLAAQCPVLGSRSGGVFMPEWQVPATANAPKVRVHHDKPDTLTEITNDPLDVARGELTRFDLLESETKTRVVFTWSHALMDAHSAEHFVAVAGRDDLPLPAKEFVPINKPVAPLKTRMTGAMKILRTYYDFHTALPKSPGIRHPNALQRQLFRIERFTAVESAQIRGHASKIAGVFGEAQYQAAVALIELKRFQEQLGCPSPSFVLPVPVGMRPKGTFEPLFSNQVTSLLMQVLPNQLGSVADAVASIKTQTERAMREAMVDGCGAFIDFLRPLPRPPYMKFMRVGLKGEICSIFYGNTAAVSPLVTTFLGAKVVDFAHNAAVPRAPGIGIVFYQFRGELRVTIAHLAETLDEAEAAQYATGLRARLLNP
jgi:hypothetical protein